MRRRVTAPAMRRRHLPALVVLLVIAACVHAQDRISEYQVKAAYLFDFGKFVRYAPSPTRQTPTFDLCIVGRNPFGHTLDDLTANEKLDGKPVRVLHLKTAADARACSIAYISASESGRLRHDLEELRGQPILTVSDAPDFLRDGGMIQFVLVGDHIRFTVNLDAARQAQVALSSELLKVAASVKGTPQPEVRP